LRLRRDRRIRRLSQVSHMGELLRQTFHRGCRGTFYQISVPLRRHGDTILSSD
jgi:hypothetical protein